MMLRRLSLLIGGVLLLGGCSNEVRSAPHGEVWPRLRERERRAFMDARQLFRREFGVQRGLGPTYNQTRCSGCHDSPGIGGGGVERVRKATRYEGGRCDLLEGQGGDVIQLFGTAALQAQGILEESAPDDANASGLAAAPALYGLAAIEAIPDEAILALADAGDANGDGISGRAGRAADGQVGRFGRKAMFATLPRFVEAELATQMGLTTRAFPNEQNVGGLPIPPGADPAKDPEIDDEIVNSLTTFVRLLAFPAAAKTPRAARDSVRQGGELFQRIGCAACHSPELRTGRTTVRGLSGKTVPLYSDLLLHDLGPALNGECAPGVQPGEWRTAPLFGLRLRPQFMHDGRVQTIESAVDLHGGEAEASRAQFSTLSPLEQAQLLRFLRSL